MSCLINIMTGLDHAGCTRIGSKLLLVELVNLTPLGSAAHVYMAALLFISSCTVEENTTT